MTDGTFEDRSGEQGNFAWRHFIYGEAALVLS